MPDEELAIESLLTTGLNWIQEHPVAAGSIAIGLGAFAYFNLKAAFKVLLLVLGLWLAYELLMLIVDFTSDSLDKTGELKSKPDA